MAKKKKTAVEQNPLLRPITLPNVTPDMQAMMEEEYGKMFRYKGFVVSADEDFDQVLAMSADGELIMSLNVPLAGALERLDALAPFYPGYDDKPDDVFFPAVAGLMMYMETMAEADSLLNEDYDDDEDDDFSDDDEFYSEGMELPPDPNAFPNILDFRRTPGRKTDD